MECIPQLDKRARQREWDKASIAKGREILLGHCLDEYDKARLLAAQAPHSGDWLNAWPITSCGLRLDNDAIRVAVGYRLGARLCIPHTCPCGANVDARGSHALSCRRGLGRQVRHSQLNDCVYRSLLRAKCPSLKEPVGLLRGDGKRPDGCTQLPWADGKNLTWDVTVPDTLAASHLEACSRVAGAAAERASALKTIKYSDILRTHLFCPIAVETMGPVNQEGSRFLDKLGNLLSEATGDNRETSFLYQRISIIIQRCNAICFTSSFRPPDDDQEI